MAWSAPTIVGKNMYVRDKVKIMALDLSASATEKVTMETGKTAEATEPVGTAEATAAEVAEVEDSEAVKLLKQVDAAIKAVEGVRYKGSAVPTGVATNFMSAAEGEGLMVGWTGSGPEKFHGRVSTTRQGTGEAMEITGGGDGETYYLIDHQAKKAYQDMDPDVMGGGGQALNSIGMLEFVHPNPFDDEIGADVVELQGKETVGGVECHKVHVAYSGGRGESTWFFSTEDYLPRRRIQHFTIPEQGEGTLEITITDLEIDPQVRPEIFRMKLPEGYQQVDDFAP